MPNYPGVLSIISNQSTLNGSLLFLAGIGDAAQAMFAATQFLVRARGLRSGQAIVVMGKQQSFHGMSIIVMTDAHASGVVPFDVTGFANAQMMAPVTTASAKAPRKKAAAKT